MSRNSAGGLTWSDGSTVRYQNWAPGEPSVIDEDCETGDVDCTEDCTEVYDNGQWNDIICKVSRAYVCKNVRPMSKCVDIPDIEKEPCGYPGIQQNECSVDYKCCYHAYSAIKCYKPGSKKYVSFVIIVNKKFF